VARPRTFDEDRAVDAAMRTFWANGYEATTTRELCAATGLGRSSIYNTFASKHDLFERALVRYIETTTAAHLAILNDQQRSAMERLHALFVMIIEAEQENRRDGRGLGCLTVNMTVELAGRDRVAARMLEVDLERRLEAMRAVIMTGQRDGDIASRRDPDALSRYINTVIAGIRVAAQGGADRAALEATAATAMDALSHSTAANGSNTGI
jgi:TetR/AcrR family transcriptional regulator, transcriptional repressor for nem operon